MGHNPLSIQQWEDFSQTLAKVKQKFKNNLLQLLEFGPVGFYGGGHIITQLSETADLVAYFDGDENKVGKSWLSNMPPINSPNLLLNKPVLNLIVVPEHHLHAITGYLRDIIGVPNSVNVYGISRLFES